jgi:hypothetical protein
LVEETEVPRVNHWPVASHWQTLSHNVVSACVLVEFFFLKKSHVWFDKFKSRHFIIDIIVPCNES